MDAVSCAKRAALLLATLLALLGPGSMASAGVPQGVWMIDGKAALQIYDCNGLMCGRLRWRTRVAAGHQGNGFPGQGDAAGRSERRGAEAQEFQERLAQSRPTVDRLDRSDLVHGFEGRKVVITGVLDVKLKEIHVLKIDLENKP